MRQMMLALAVVLSALALAAPAGATTPAAGAKAADSPGAAKETVSPGDTKQLAVQYYEEGTKAYEAGDLNSARVRLRAAVRLDPDHARAKTLLKTVEDKLGITEADKLREKLGTRIPEVKFEKASVKEVLDFLAREADVNIVFDASALDLLASDRPAEWETPKAAEGAQVESEEAERGFEGAEAGPPAVGQPGPARTDLITIQLKNVPLKEVLKYVLRFKGLKYIVEDYAIVIVPVGWVDRGDLVTEIFHLTTSGLGARELVDRLRNEPAAWESGRY